MYKCSLSSEIKFERFIIIVQDRLQIFYFPLVSEGGKKTEPVLLYALKGSNRNAIMI